MSKPATPTIAQQIIRSSLFRSGEPFGPLRMAKAIDHPIGSVAPILRKMGDRGDVSYSGKGLYSKPQPRWHWIHRAALHDAKGLRAARAA